MNSPILRHSWQGVCILDGSGSNVQADGVDLLVGIFSNLDMFSALTSSPP